METKIIIGQLAFAITFLVVLIAWILYLFLKPEKGIGLQIMKNMPPPPEKREKLIIDIEVNSDKAIIKLLELEIKSLKLKKEWLDKQYNILLAQKEAKEA